MVESDRGKVERWNLDNLDIVSEGGFWKEVVFELRFKG